MRPDYFTERKSCRFFKPQKINQELLTGIIEKAMKAPTCGNMQLYTVIATENGDNLRELSSFHYNQPAASTAPLILTICADFNKFTKWCEINDADAGFDNFHSFLTAMTDAIIFAQQIVTVAENEGLGTCYLGTVTYNATEISKLLDLPEFVVPVASLAIGYIDREGEETERMKADGVLFYEKYARKTSNELTQLYNYLENIPDKEKFLKENSKENIAQIFSEVRYPRETNEKISEEYYYLLKEKGFIK